MPISIKMFYDHMMWHFQKELRDKVRGTRLIFSPFSVAALSSFREFMMSQNQALYIRPPKQVAGKRGGRRVVWQMVVEDEVHFSSALFNPNRDKTCQGMTGELRDKAYVCCLLGPATDVRAHAASSWRQAHGRVCDIMWVCTHDRSRHQLLPEVAEEAADVRTHCQVHGPGSLPDSAGPNGGECFSPAGSECCTDWHAGPQFAAHGNQACLVRQSAVVPPRAESAFPPPPFRHQLQSAAAAAASILPPPPPLPRRPRCRPQRPQCPCDIPVFNEYTGYAFDSTLGFRARAPLVI